MYVYSTVPWLISPVLCSDWLNYLSWKLSIPVHTWSYFNLGLFQAFKDYACNLIYWNAVCVSFLSLCMWVSKWMNEMQIVWMQPFAFYLCVISWHDIVFYVAAIIYWLCCHSLNSRSKTIIMTWVSQYLCLSSRWQQSIT